MAYRYFSTDKRKFIIADTPGHEQYTRNMATGASTANLAVILIDARKGVLTQTRRHSFIVSLLGIRHAVVAINKMDLMGYDKQVYDTSWPTTPRWPPRWSAGYQLRAGLGLEGRERGASRYRHVLVRRSNLARTPGVR